MFGLVLSGFAATTLGFLWPGSSGGFGAKFQVGTLADILAKIDEGQGFAYYPEGRMSITPLPRGDTQHGPRHLQPGRAGRHGGRDRTGGRR